MKQLINLILAFSMLGNFAYADCDFTMGKGVNKLPDGNFEYSKECHVQVGKLVQSNGIQTQQVDDLKKAITLKDLAIQDSDARTQVWMDTSLKLEKNINAIDELKNTNSWIYFGLGVLTVIGTGFALSAVTNRH
jgi:hypothetical protein